MDKNKRDKTKFLLKLTFCFSLLLMVLLVLPQYSNKSFATDEDITDNQATSTEYIYLSDISDGINPIASSVGSGSLNLNKAADGSKISVKVGGIFYSFEKGIWAHAKSTVDYDLREYDYDYFTAYLGINQTATSSNGVVFKIHTSTDGVNWHTKYNEEGIVCKQGENATFVKIDIKTEKYLRLSATTNGSNAHDHAVYANAKLIKEGYDEAFVDYEKLKPLSYYDNILTAPGYDYNTDEAHSLIMEREFVRKISYERINILTNFEKETKETIDWIADNPRVLEKCVEVGEIGNPTIFLKVVGDLYRKYKDDLKTENGDVYEKMIIGMAAGYSTNKVSSPLKFSHISPSYDCVERFGLIKELYDGGLIQYGNGWKTYHVEFFRYIMNDSPRNDEVKWINYIGRAKKYATGVYSYVAYIKPNYSKSAKPYLYDMEEIEKRGYDSKYKLTENGVPLADNTTRFWMVMAAGGICWNQARFAKSVIIGMGRPAISVYQPTHESALFYKAANSDGTGKGTWDITGNIFGWGKTANAWGGGNRSRTLFNWAGKSFTSSNISGSRYGDSAAYVWLAQDNINRYEDYKASVYLNLLANSFTDNEAKLKLYNEALAVDNINLDSYDYKIQMYKALNKTSEEWHQLALDVIDNYNFYPMAMGDLIKLIKPYLNGVDRVDIDQRYYNALVKAKGASGTACKQIASTRLSAASNKLASFSFDGADAGKIVLSKDYDTFTDLMWKYSLDGGVTKSEGTLSHAFQLSKEELAKINDVDDIKIYIVGLNEANPTYTIDIVKGSISSSLYGNDLENRVVGVELTYEWRYNEIDEWTCYRDASPDCTGDQTLYVRNGATGNALPSETQMSFTFTEDNQPDTRKYISVEHLAIEGYSTQSQDSKRPFYAPNAIDGNGNTLWHTDFAIDISKGTENPFITIKLDSSKYISALEFTQIKYPGKPKDPDFVKNMIVYVSEDGENWTEAGKIENCTDYNALREVTFAESVYGKYVKLEMGKDDTFASISMINLFEDTTKIDHTIPTASVVYSTHEITNGYVVARLVNSSTHITITNNGGNDTYVFTENGEFTFEFVDENGNEGTAIAKVDWIDKDGPTADVEYELDTDRKLIVSLDGISEDVYLLDNNNNKINYIEVENGKVTSILYLDSSGDTSKKVEVDDKGNITRITYKNINGSEEVSDVSTYIVTMQNGLVVEGEEEYLDDDGNPVDVSDAGKEELRMVLEQTTTNPLECTFGDSGECEFKLADKASNIVYKSIKVDYIEDDTVILASDITYSVTKLTNTNVVATINPYIIDTSSNDTSNKHTSVEVISEGGTTHTFTENGEFTFQYKSASDTENVEVKQHKAKVDWIDKVAPTAEISYSTTEATDKAVVATLVNESEEIVITNNGISKEYTFTENGTFTFKFQDKAGNEGTAIATVDWIVEDTTITSDKYKVRAGYISRITIGTTVAEFKKNVNSNEELTITDAKGNALQDEDTLATGMTLTVGTDKQYTLAIIGDIDKNGKITITDLVKLKLYTVHILTPDAVEKIAADMNGDENITITDLVKLNLKVVHLD